MARFLTLFPLLLWAFSFFFPAITYNSNDWFFPGKNSGYLAAFMSMLALLFALQLLKDSPRHLAEILFFLFLGSLCICNFIIVAAPFVAGKIRQARPFLIILWISVALGSFVPFFFRNSADTNHLEFGFFAWLLSLVAMAIVMTGLYLAAPKATSTFTRPSKAPK